MRFFRSKTKHEPAPLKIDAVTMAPDGTVSLFLGHTESDALDMLQARIHSCVGFALDGQMVRQYPETTGHPVKIVLVVDRQPAGDLATYLESVEPRLEAYGVGLVVEVSPTT